MFALKRLRYSFALLNQKILVELQQQYTTTHDHELLKPYLERDNVPPLFHLIMQTKHSSNDLITPLKMLENVSALDSQQQINLSANIKKELSINYLMRRNIADAISNAEEALLMIKMMDNPFIVELATYHHHLGEVYLMSKVTMDKAEFQLLQAVKLFEQAQKQELNKQLVQTYLSFSYSRLSWFYMMKSDFVKAMQYINSAMEYWNNCEKQQGKNYQFTVRTKCLLHKKFKEIDELRNEATQILSKKNITIFSRVWFLNILIKAGFKENNDEFESTLQLVKKKLNPKEFDLFMKSIDN